MENPSWAALARALADRGGATPYSLRSRSSHLEARPGLCRRPAIGVTDQRIWLDGLPEAFRGFRILQLSDIHHSLFFPLDRVAAVVELGNRLKPDLIALTGDFVTYSRDSIEPVAEILGALRSALRRRCRAGQPRLSRRRQIWSTRALRRRGIEVLRNRHVLLREGGDVLHIAGVDDYRYGADLEAALRGVPARRTDGPAGA